MTAGAAIRGPAQEPGTSAFGRLGQGHASRQSTGGVTAGAAICCPTQDLRTSTPGGLGQGHASRHFASLSLEASGSAEPGGPGHGTSREVNPSSTIRRYGAGVAMVHATVAIHASGSGGGRIPRVAWTIATRPDHQDISIRLTSRCPVAGPDVVAALCFGPIATMRDRTGNRSGAGMAGPGQAPLLAGAAGA